MKAKLALLLFAWTFITHAHASCYESAYYQTRSCVNDTTTYQAESECFYSTLTSMGQCYSTFATEVKDCEEIRTWKATALCYRSLVASTSGGTSDSSSGSCGVFGCPPAGGSCNTFGCSGPGGGCGTFGCWQAGGGCNTFGCWQAGGGCNTFGCWQAGGSCTTFGCN